MTVNVTTITGANDSEELYFLATHADDIRFMETLTVRRAALGQLVLLDELNALKQRVEDKRTAFLDSEAAAAAALENLNV
jgi:hypothetical protein